MPSRSSNDDAEPLAQFTLEEVALHNSAEDCWVVVNGKVYELTKYLDDHPGGDQVLLAAAGEDATEEFEDAGHSRDARALMEHYCIGELPTSKTEFRSEVLHRVALPMVASIAIIGLAVTIYYWCNISETSSERLPDASFVEDLRPESKK